MIALYGLIGISAIGIGVVFWMLKKDTDDEQSNIPLESAPISPQESADSPPKPSLLSKLTSFGKKPAESTDQEPETKESSGLLGGLLSKLSFGKKKQEDDTPETAPLPNLNEYVGEQSDQNAAGTDKPAPLGTSNILATPPESPAEENAISKEEEGTIEKEIELSGELSELKEKYEKLEALFNEKSTECETSKESLNNELENRKEFNKVKDVLEKELKDAKDNAHNIQGELNNTQTENENHKKRITQLEEKTTKLEKELLEKEDNINDLVKKMQTFASPSTAATPPETEESTQEAAVVEDAPEIPAQQPSEDQPQTNEAAEETQAEPDSPAEDPIRSDSEPAQEEAPAQAEEIPQEETPQPEEVVPLDEPIANQDLPPPDELNIEEQVSPQSEDIQEESAPPAPEEPPKSEESSNDSTRLQDAITEQESAIAQSVEGPPIPKVTEEETQDAAEKEEESTEPAPSEDESTQKSGFTLDLSINDESPPEPESGEENFLKLQPDVLSEEPQDAPENPNEPPQAPPEESSEEEKPNP